MITDYSVAYIKSSFNKSLVTIFLIISSADVHAACTVNSIAYNEAGRPGSGVAVVTAAGGFITNTNLRAWASGDDVTTCDVSQIDALQSTFLGKSSFNQDISTWDVSGVTSMTHMFYGATQFNQDISLWDVGNVTTMQNMFYKAASFNHNISAWNVDFVTDMRGMFQDATNFDRDISLWNVGNVVDMQQMFHGAAAFNQNIGIWNVSKVVTMQYMFLNASAFNQDLGPWNVVNVQNMDQMFNGSALGNANYDLILVGWSALSVQSGISISFGNAVYSESAARNVLTNTYSWTISDGSSLASPTEKNEVKASVIAMSHIVTNFAQQSQTIIENRLQWLSRQKDNTQTSYQGIKFKFSNPILDKIANNKGGLYRSGLNQMVNSVNQDDEPLTASKQMITSDATDLLITEAAKYKNQHIGTLNPIFKAIDGWSVWTAGQITIGKVKGSSTSSQSDMDSQVLSVGLDKKNERGLVGYMFSIGQAKADINGNASEIKSDNYGLSTYRSFLYNTKSLDVITGVSLFKIDTVRVDGSDRLEGRRDARQIYLMTKYNDNEIKLNRFILAPYGKVSLAYSELKAFSESGASTALHYKKQTISDMLLSVGTDINFIKTYKHGTLSPYALAEYSIDVSDSSTADMYYVGQSTQYSLRINKKATSIYKLGIGADYQSNSGLISSVYYERAQAVNSGHNDKLNLSINFKF